MEYVSKIFGKFFGETINSMKFEACAVSRNIIMYFLICFTDNYCISCFFIVLLRTEKTGYDWNTFYYANDIIDSVTFKHFTSEQKELLLSYKINLRLFDKINELICILYNWSSEWESCSKYKIVVWELFNNELDGHE